METSPINNSVALTAGQYATLLAIANTALSASVNVRFVLQDLTQNAGIRLAVCPENYVSGATPAVADWIIPVGKVIGPSGETSGIYESKAVVMEPGQKLVAFATASIVTASVTGYVRTDNVTIPSAGPDVLAAIDAAVEAILDSNIQAKVNAAVPPAVETAIADSATVTTAVNSAVSTAMVAAKTEITAAVLLALKTSPVQYDAGMSHAVIDKGTVTTGTVTFNVSQGNIQKVTAGGNFTIAISGWPAAGIYGEVRIEIVDGGEHALTIPGDKWELSSATATYPSLVAYLTALGRVPAALKTDGSDFLYYWSDDGGVTVRSKVM